jgi:GR25 family glycosyltransferase involved in LPS biosynthesis
MNSYVISLSKIETSKTSSIEVFNSLKKYNLNPVLFEGTYGNDAEKLFLEENRQLHPIDMDTSAYKFRAPGVKGCFMSHYNLWKLCADINQSIMIFEDDVVFYRNFVPVEFEDILILSINYDWKVLDFLKTYLEDNHDLETIVRYNNFFIPGASGYIITPHAAKKLLDVYRNTYLPVDWAINRTICEIKIHPQLMGRSKTMNEKESLTRLKTWNI